MHTLKPRLAQYLWALVLLAGIALFVAGSGAPANASASAPQPKRLLGVPAQLAPATGVTITTYLPAILASPDLAVNGLEVTQSVQTPGNSVPLVAGRRTMLRVYAASLTGDSLSNVRVSVAATRNGTALLGSPLVVGPQAAPTAPSRANYGSTFNVELPSNWLSGGIVITATAYQGTTPYVNATNWSSLALNFNTVPTLNVMVVPIQYTHTPTGQTYPAPAANSTTANEIRDWIMRAYPVSDVAISFHPVFVPYSPFVGDLTQFSDWNTLLTEIDALKGSESNPLSQVYYGLIPTTNSSGTWFTTGYSGLGYISYRVSIGLELPTSAGWGADQTGQTAAHEIGHNLGRYHAPCGNPANPDPNYPYANGSIGQFGLDIPKGVLWNPAITYDLMSYCNPEWVSDYTYQGLYNDQMANGAAVLGAAAPGLFIRGAFTAGGQVSLKPVYALSLPLTPLPAASDYQAELLDAQGKVLATYPVPVVEAIADPTGEVARSISAVVPQPAQLVARVRLTHTGQMVAEKSLIPTSVAPAAAPSVTRQAGAVTVRWNGPAQPALVRYSADGGQTWTTVGVDVLGGELTLNSADLPAGGAGQFDVTLAEP